ncbi:hypothetical protein M5D96_004878 [Drosophila gunungcola]|uniref:Uncharacterized protein n=1 Tax=Drosophila gunungcola TaxID=103775 RepID=A0A9P9YUY4_9MUSC|nr:hypothetical protein M5D96_004878 [Drosophila gunungcola]
MGEVRGQISLGFRNANALEDTPLLDTDTNTHTTRCRYNQQTINEPNLQHMRCI